MRVFGAYPLWCAGNDLAETREVARGVHRQARAVVRGKGDRDVVSPSDRWPLVALTRLQSGVRQAPPVTLACATTVVRGEGESMCEWSSRSAGIWSWSRRGGGGV